MDYKFKRVAKNGYIITEEGHTMFPEDVKSRLDRLVYLEEKLSNDAHSLLCAVRDLPGSTHGTNECWIKLKDVIELLKEHGI